MTRDLLHALATDIKAALLWLPRRVGEWALGPQMDDVVCRFSNVTGQEQP